MRIHVNEQHSARRIPPARPSQPLRSRLSRTSPVRNSFLRR